MQKLTKTLDLLNKICKKGALFSKLLKSHSQSEVAV